MSEATEEFVPCRCALMGDCSEFYRLRFREKDEEAATAHKQAAYAREREARLAEAPDPSERLRRMGVPGVVVSVVAGKPLENACLTAAKAFLAHDRAQVPVLALLGVPGEGKTVAAAWVLRDFARRWDWNGRATGENDRPPAVFMEARRFTRLSTFDFADREAFQHALGAKLLVLDDLGDEAHDFGKAQLVDLLLSRIDRNRATVLTSNMNFEAFRRRYGEALFDRLRTRALMPALKGGSMRKKPEVRP